jgi:FkbM family methyltransferase
MYGIGETASVYLDGFTLTFPKRFLPHYVFREYEPLTRNFFLGFLRPDMVVIDVGAHIGYFTLLAARAVGATGKVYSLEPYCETYRYLRENVARNGLANVVVFDKAAGASQRLRSFHITGSSDSNGFYSHPLADTVAVTEVEETPLDLLVRRRVDAVKIDVEGAEFEVLAGMRRILSENHQIRLCVEWNPACLRNAGSDPLALPEHLRQLGFDRILVIDDSARTALTLETFLRRVDLAMMPDTWYANLWAIRGTDENSLDFA